MKEITDFSNHIQHIFKSLSVNGKPTLIGSSKLDNFRYRTDYDLQEFATVLDVEFLIQTFQQKFHYFEGMDNLFITDFKCGLYQGKPIRWNKVNIQSKKQTVHGKIITLNQCFLMKSTIKLDVVALFNNVFVEFSINYYFTIGNHTTFSPKSKDQLLEDLRNDVILYSTRGDLYKALKRLFSFYRLEGKQIQKEDILLQFFNSQVGFLNKCKNDLSLILTLLENKFRKPRTSDISHNLLRIEENLESLTEIDLKQKLIDSLELIAKRKSQREMKEGIQLVIHHLNEKSNLLSKEFLEQNNKYLTL